MMCQGCELRRYPSGRRLVLGRLAVYRHSHIVPLTPGLGSEYTHLLRVWRGRVTLLLMAIINRGFKGRPHDGKPLPPGQSAVEEWPVLTYGPTPHIATANWSLV